MAISDDLNSIRTHLEDDYTALEQLGISVEDRNIENIKDMANQIYAKFPKTDYAEGSNITLSNTLKGKLDYENGVVGIGQIEQESTHGYNLLDVYNNMDGGTASGLTYKINVDGIVSITGTATNYSGKYSKGGFNSTTPILTLKANHTYRILLEVANNTGSVRFYMGPTGQNPYYISNITTNGVFTQDYTISEDVTITQFSFIGGQVNNVQNNCVMKVALIDITNKEYNVWEQYTGGQASPNPSYPQEIEVVRGKNRWGGINGFNEQNKAITNENGTITVNLNNDIVTSMTTLQAVRSNSTKILKADTYTFSVVELPENMICEIVKVNNPTSGTVFKTLRNGKLDTTFTITEDMEYFIRIQISIATTYQGTIKPMIEPGSTATSYLPYNTIEVVERGKNWFTGENILDNTIVGVSRRFDKSELILNGTSTGNGVIIGNNKIITLPKGTYTFKLSLLSGTYDRNGKDLAFYIRNSENYINGNHANSGLSFYDIITYPNKKVNFTLEEQTDIYLVSNINGDGFVFNDVKIGFQIESGDTYSDYEPYQTPQTYQLSLGEYEFARIGNYADELLYDVDEDKVYKNEKIKEITINSSYRTNAKSTGTNAYYISTNINNALNDNAIALAYSNMFRPCSFNDRNGAPDSVMSQNGSITLRTRNNTNLDWSSNSKADTWLNANLPLVCYVLATPVLTELTDTTLKQQVKNWYYSQSFNDTTIIESNGDLPMIIKVRSLKGN